MPGFKINPTKDFEYVILDALGLNIARYIIAACIKLRLNTNVTYLGVIKHWISKSSIN